jgi:hypothetical protein
MAGSSVGWLIPAASHGVSRHFEDSDPKNQSGYGFPLDPCGVWVRPLGVRSTSRSTGRSRPKALLALSRPFRDMSPQPRTTASWLRPEGLRSSVSAMLPLLGFPALRHLPVGDSALGQRVPPPPRATSEVWLPPSRPSSPSSRRRSAGASLGFALQGVLLDRKRCPFRGPCPPDVTRVALPFPRERSLLAPPTGLLACDEFVLSPGDRSRLAVDTFLGFSPSERSPHTSGLSLLVTMPALSSLGGVTSLPAWTSRLRGTHGSAGPFPSCQLSWGFAPYDCHNTPFVVPGSGLMVSPRAGCCLTGSPTALLASSVPTQSRFLGS